jgi:hypothetical protein
MFPGCSLNVHSSEESSWSIGAEFRATARLLDNYSNMVITHAYEKALGLVRPHMPLFFECLKN